MAAHVDAGRVLLDSEALSRTIARIAHEIVEGNSDLAVSRSSASRREACRSRSGSGA